MRKTTNFLRCSCLRFSLVHLSAPAFNNIKNISGVVLIADGFSVKHLSFSFVFFFLLFKYSVNRVSSLIQIELDSN